MDAAGWVRVFEIAKSYGINHYRFHSWCPPEAAFAAADELGIYLQPELPNFGGNIGEPPAKATWCLEEGRRILRAYGDHPSFVMLALGNELVRGQDVRADLVRKLRQYDPRQLFAQGSNNDFASDAKFAVGDDYWTTVRTHKGADGAVRGSFAHVDAPLGHVQDRTAGHDLRLPQSHRRRAGAGHRPTRSGSTRSSPTSRRSANTPACCGRGISKFFAAGSRPRACSTRADDFLRASGALAVVCYREDIESALRTRGFGGFQMLDLQDFPGQGTALVGILDALMDSKGLIAPHRWREFCSETVPLAVFSRYTWTTGESFTADGQGGQLRAGRVCGRSGVVDDRAR